MRHNGSLLTDTSSPTGMAMDGPGCLVIPQGRKRIAAMEPSMETGTAEELRYFLMAMSVILSLVLLAGARLLAAV